VEDQSEIPANQRPPWLRPAFDYWSRTYDNPAVQALIYRPVHSLVVRELRAANASSVLDVGCGTGILLDRLQRELAIETVGCDWSPGMLEQARRRRSGFSLLRADAGCLPLSDGRFDAVVTTEAFHWFPDQPGALKEFHRVLRPGGRLLIALVNPSTRTGGRALAGAARLLGGAADWPTRRMMRDQVKNAGFSVRSQHRALRALRMVVPTVVTVAVKPG
jgi:ubiquinone/menaquinone biosynthesis C-methylase UbiE